MFFEFLLYALFAESTREQVRVEAHAIPKLCLRLRIVPRIPRLHLIPPRAEIWYHTPMQQQRVLGRGRVAQGGHALEIYLQLCDGLAGVGVGAAGGFVGGDEGKFLGFFC